MSARDGRLHAGAAPVGVLADAHPDDRLFVACLRLWLEAPEGRDRAAAAVALARGAEAARRAAPALEAFLGAVAGGAARRFWRHPPGCACIGRDEAALAALVRAAGAGAIETAHGAAAALVRAEARFAVAQSAAELGRALADRGPDDPARAAARAPQRG